LDLLYPSTYSFKFSGSDGSQVAIAGKKLSYVIVIPTFYKSTLWANSAPQCRFTELSANSSCSSYESEIVVTETFTSNFTSLTLTVSSILNPAVETFCNTTDVTLLSHTFFKIRIIEDESNAFLFESSAVVDGSNCMKFSSVRIPITLEYPLIMVAGLTYNITYGLTKPASNLKINAYINSQNGFTFSPSVVEFNDYYTLRNSTTLYLRSDIAAGTYVVNFNKFES
jgi:putative component of membrane protein insertase Oxa1/YidC/SpoIIIJ protein YidD